MNKSVYSFLVVLAGVLSAVIFIAGPARFENYFVDSGLGEFLVIFYRGLLGFFFGA